MDQSEPLGFGGGRRVPESSTYTPGIRGSVGVALFVYLTPSAEVFPLASGGSIGPKGVGQPI
jgi:hypothetical protein